MFDIALEHQRPSSSHPPFAVPQETQDHWRGDVLDAEQPKKKRPRIGLACLRCRRRRERCMGEQPTCSRCAANGEFCEWPNGRKPKARKSERAQPEQQKKESSPRLEDVHPAVVPPHSQAPTVQSLGAASDWPISSDPLQHHQQQHLITQQSVPPPPSAAQPPPPPGLQPVPQESDSFAASLFDPSWFQQHAIDTDFAQSNFFSRLEQPVAWVHDDPSNENGLELFYYRLAGVTAIKPGFNRISLKLMPKSNTGDSKAVGVTLPQSPEDAAAEAAAGPGAGGAPTTSPTSIPPELSMPLFAEDGMPLPHVYEPLIDFYFKHMSQHFPSTSRRRLKQRLETGTMSTFTMNCICALSARFSSSPSGSSLSGGLGSGGVGTSGASDPAKACAPFLAKSQELLPPLVHLPTYDAVTGLTLLAWANYGQNSDSALWAFSGLAIRMSADLGMHEVSEIYESKAHLRRTRLLFWSLFLTDRILSFAHGRPTAIDEETIELPLPTDDEFVPSMLQAHLTLLTSVARDLFSFNPAPDSDLAAPLDSFVEPVPFVHLVRLMVLCGRISNVLNSRQGKHRPLARKKPPSPTELAELQSQLVEFYRSIPSGLAWSVENLQRYEARGLGGSFLVLHLWSNAVLAMLHHPGLADRSSGVDTPLAESMSRDIRVSLSCSRNITDCLVFSELAAPQALVSSPFAAQPIFVAGLAVIHEMKASQLGFKLQDAQPASGIFRALARQDLTTVMKALVRLEQPWAGVQYVRESLMERASGLDFQAPEASKGKTFVSVQDRGLLQRYKKTNLPYSTNAPSKSTMQDHEDQESVSESGPSPATVSSFQGGSGGGDLSLQDILAEYSVQGASCATASDADLAWLFVPQGQQQQQQSRS